MLSKKLFLTESETIRASFPMWVSQLLLCQLFYKQNNHPKLTYTRIITREVKTSTLSNLFPQKLKNFLKNSSNLCKNTIISSIWKMKHRIKKMKAACNSIKLVWKVVFMYHLASLSPNILDATLIAQLNAL